MQSATGLRSDEFLLALSSRRLKRLASGAARFAPKLLAAAVAVACAQAGAATRNWNGLGVDDNWGTAGNWMGSLFPVAGDSITFTGGARPGPINNLGLDFSVLGISFAVFTSATTSSDLSASHSVLLGTGGITNNSTTAQTVNNTLKLAGNQTWTTATNAGPSSLAAPPT